MDRLEMSTQWDQIQSPFQLEHTVASMSYTSEKNQTLVNSGVVLLQQVCNTEIVCNSDAFLWSFMIFRVSFKDKEFAVSTLKTSSTTQTSVDGSSHQTGYSEKVFVTQIRTKGSFVSLGLKIYTVYTLRK